MLGVNADNEFVTAVFELPLADEGVADTELQPVRAELVPQQNVTVVDVPFALTVPLMTADVSVTLVAD